MNQPATIANHDHAIKRHDSPQTLSPVSPRDIFDTLDHWLASPGLAYSSWLAGQALKDSTKTVYIAMFGRFCQWLAGQGRRLDQLEANHIRRFLDSVNPNLPESRKSRTNSGRQRQQYVRQLEKVFAHLGSLATPGPTRAGWQGMSASALDPTSPPGSSPAGSARP